MCRHLVAIAARQKVGNGHGRGHELPGPIQNPATSSSACASSSRDARAAGAASCAAASLPPGKGYLPADLVADIADGTRLVDEEPFGLVLPVIRYRDVDRAVRLAQRQQSNSTASAARCGRATRRPRGWRTAWGGTVWISSQCRGLATAPSAAARCRALVEFGLEGLLRIHPPAAAQHQPADRLNVRSAHLPAPPASRHRPQALARGAADGPGRAAGERGDRGVDGATAYAGAAVRRYAGARRSWSTTLHDTALADWLAPLRPTWLHWAASSASACCPSRSSFARTLAEASAAGWRSACSTPVASPRSNVRSNRSFALLPRGRRGGGRLTGAWRCACGSSILLQPVFRSHPVLHAQGPDLS